MKVLLDTHALVWLATDDVPLGRRSRQLANAASTDGSLYVSAVSFWEVGMLVARGRLATPTSAAEMRAQALAAGYLELPLTGPVALLAATLDLHRDPVDRFLAATAMLHDAVLVTADERLLAWPNALRRQDARR
ncbi:MAG: type II toxin-antitoxin system VapC family toxin [Steroidobacteraceae bacterium]|nr:type II toxin-antitoxin system VapC family toxin [Steroidobacteraceae bacterium]